MGEGRARRAVFTLIAVVAVPLALLGALELVLRAAGVGYDPGFFVGRTIDGRHVLTDNPRFGWRFFTPDLARAPQPFALAKEKPEGELRVFVLGGSAAMGDPTPSAGMPHILQAMLEQCLPDRPVRVVNAAMTAINSHVVLPIARDCLRDGRADVLVVYLGNNEVVGPFGAGSIFGVPGAGLRVSRFQVAFQATRLGQLLSRVVRAVTHGGGGEPQSWAGMELFLENRLDADDPKLDVVYENFRANLSDLCREAQRRGVPVVLSTVAVNLRDCAPFSERPLRAHVLYRAGLSRLALGQTEEAAAQLREARDLDALRFRADSGIRRVIREVGEEFPGVVAVDAEAKLQAADPAGVAGAALFDDHVHPRFRGNLALSTVLAVAVLDALDAPPDAVKRIPFAERCAERIGYGPWKRRATVQLMKGRRERPPFTGQLDREEWERRIDAELAELAPATQAQHLRRAAAGVARQVEAHPDDWMLREDLAELLLRVDDVPGALRERRELARRFPYQAGMHYGLGEALARAGRAGEAMEAYRTAIDIDPRHFLAQNRLGEELVDAGDVEAALPHFETAARVEPRLGVAHRNRGDALLKLGRTDEAVTALRRAIDVNPELAAAHKKLGDALEKQGKRDDAAAAYRRALEINPAYRAARERLERVNGAAE